MLVAYDTLLQTIVSADSASQNGDNEAYRYECLFCGEEVSLAAQDSYHKATHFRHKHGNNDKKCEYYLGQYGLIDSHQKSYQTNQERIDFYYEHINKCFYVNICFNENEINHYEEQKSKIEIRKDRQANPFLSVNINHQNFYQDDPSAYPIEEYSSHYYISNTSNNIKKEYNVFSDTSPTLFKIHGDEPNFKAKYVRGKSICTKVRYYLAWPGQNTANIKLKNMTGVKIEEVFEFTTFRNTTVWSMIVTFEEKNCQLDELLLSWGYNLTNNETLTILWPPVYKSEDTCRIQTSRIYLHSSFRLQGKGNINVGQDRIQYLGTDVTKIDWDRHQVLKILKKNVELTIHILDNNCEIGNALSPTIIEKPSLTIPDGNFFYFSKYGIQRVEPGFKIFLTSSSYIVEYFNNYPIKKYVLPQPITKPLEQNIEDVLRNYWVTIPYNPENENSYDDLSYNVANYIAQCSTSGTINQAIRKLLKENECG